MTSFYSLPTHCYNRAHGRSATLPAAAGSHCRSGGRRRVPQERFSLLHPRRSHRRRSARSLRAGLERMDALHPDFVINVGDTIQGGNDATAASEWRALRPLWDRYRYPHLLHARQSRHLVAGVASDLRTTNRTPERFTASTIKTRTSSCSTTAQAPDLSGQPERRPNAVSRARSGAKSRSRSQVCFLPQALLADPGEISERPVSLSSVDREIRRALRGERPRTPIRARTSRMA